MKYLLTLALLLTLSCSDSSSTKDDSMQTQGFVLYIDGVKFSNTLPMKIEKIGNQITIWGESINASNQSDIYAIVLANPKQGDKIQLGDSSSSNYFIYNLYALSNPNPLDRYTSRSGTVEITTLNDSICKGNFEVVAKSSFGKEDRKYTNGRFYGNVILKK